ncbi:MAG: RNA 2',3'-cyclic phosphodiesterase [Bacteroidales bacterium]|nr:RNA 2',3'-cyclic phosphodiesterase [Bacteroidales bacterium]
MDMQTIRTFIAIPVAVPVEMQDLINELRQEIGGSSNTIKWVDLSQLHFTLRFLGEIDASLVPAISRFLEEGVSGFYEKSVLLEGLGLFGPARSPRIIWVGLRGDDFFDRLKKSIDASLGALFPSGENQPFRPHLTIGRVKHAGDPVSLRNSIERFRKDFSATVSLNRIIFYQSILQKKGPLYSPLNTIILKQG